MNTAYYVNKIIGVGFAIGLIAAGGYQFVKWRDQMAKEAGRRMQKRMQQIGDETMAELQKNAPKWDQFQMSPEMMKGFGGVTFPTDGRSR